MVRKLSKDSSKFRGSTASSRVRMPAPLLVMSVTPHERTPTCPLKNSNAPLAILVLSMDLRSPMSIRLCTLDEFLVDPTPAVVPPPDLSKNQPAGDRSPR